MLRDGTKNKQKLTHGHEEQCSDCRGRGEVEVEEGRGKKNDNGKMK